MALVVAVVAALAPVEALAGRVYYGWLYGTEVMPERGAEIQTWVLEENGVGDAKEQKTLWWLGALVGVTDQLELAFPVEMEWTRSRVADPNFTFSRWGAEARYRLITQDPVEAPAFAPLVRVALKRDVSDRGMLRPELDVIASYECGRVHALVDLGLVGEITRDRNDFEVRPGAGVSIRAVGDLRLGAEVYAELNLDSDGGSWAVVGPNLAWTHGRFWLSASYGIGVYNVRTAPRVMWGIAF